MKILITAVMDAPNWSPIQDQNKMNKFIYNMEDLFEQSFHLDYDKLVEPYMRIIGVSVKVIDEDAKDIHNV